MSDFDPLPDFGAALERVLRERAAAPSSEVMPDFRDALDRELRRRAAVRASFAEVMPDFRAVLERELRRRAAAGPGFEVMPDFLAALEQNLRTQASTTRARSARRHPLRPALHWRRPAFAAALAISLLAQAIMVNAPVVRETPAFGSPPILALPARVPPRELARRGFFAVLETGATEARVISAFGRRAYLLHGGNVWCLYVPDPDADHPAQEMGVACARTPGLFRLGLSLWIGRRYVAVLAGGVSPPTLRHADGTIERLVPSRYGVVAVEDLRAGDRITLHGTDGRTRVDRNPALDVAARAADSKQRGR